MNVRKIRNKNEPGVVLSQACGVRVSDEPSACVSPCARVGRTVEGDAPRTRGPHLGGGGGRGGLGWDSQTGGAAAFTGSCPTGHWVLGPGSPWRRLGWTQHARVPRVSAATGAWGG